MITVSLISEYLYCPFKVYLHKYHSDIVDKSLLTNQITHETMRGFEEILKRNLWVLKGKMKIRRILEELFKGVPEYLEEIYEKYQDEIYYEGYGDEFERLKEDMILNSWIIGLKIQKLLYNGINGPDAADILFPTCLIEYEIEDRELGLSGKVDMIEIIDGVYYPIKIKRTLPPLKGVWQSDALQITGYAILMEREFNKEIQVGFVNYTKIGSRKPVLIGSSLREKFTEVFNEMTYVVYDGYKPEVVQNVAKCRRCTYYEICDYAMD